MGILDSILTGGLSNIVSTGMEIVNKFIEDPNKKMEAQLEMLRITQSSEFKELDFQLQQMQMQAEINKIEAASENIFKSGWRPAVGWVCVAGFFMQVMMFPSIEAICNLFHYSFVRPEMDVELIITTLGGLLGLGTMRTIEKIKRSK